MRGWEVALAAVAAAAAGFQLMMIARLLPLLKGFRQRAAWWWMVLWGSATVWFVVVFTLVAGGVDLEGSLWLRPARIVQWVASGVALGLGARAMARRQAHSDEVGVKLEDARQSLQELTGELSEGE